MHSSNYDKLHSRNLSNANWALANLLYDYPQHHFRRDNQLHERRDSQIHHSTSFASIWCRQCVPSLYIWR